MINPALPSLLLIGNGHLVVWRMVLQILVGVAGTLGVSLQNTTTGALASSVFLGSSQLRPSAKPCCLTDAGETHGDSVF